LCRKPTGFIEYWKEKGFPAQCRPLSENDFECELSQGDVNFNFYPATFIASIEGPMVIRTIPAHLDKKGTFSGEMRPILYF
jgi:hypothetical protein